MKKVQVKKHKKELVSFVLMFIVVSFSVGCGLAVTRPKIELSIATAAFWAAKTSNAPKLAPQLFHKAEYYYIKAKTTYRQKFFNKAKQYALLSKKFSERAEFKARRQQAFGEHKNSDE